MFSLLRGVVAALAGACIGAISVTLLYAQRPGLSFDLELPLPSFIDGVYGVERDASGGPFAWTTSRVAARFDGLDRTAPWTCLLRFRSPRPPDLPQPSITVTVDSSPVANTTGAGEYHELGFRVPASPSKTAALAIDVSPTFQPGGADPRTLGIQINRLSCTPTRFAWPPRRAVLAGAGVAGVLAGASALVDLSIGWSLLVALIAGLGAGAMLTTAGGFYGGYPRLIGRIAIWVGLSAALVAGVFDRIAKERLTRAARAVLVISAVALWLKLIALMHPAKPVIDAMFHAHRLNDVLNGKYLFTQPVAGVEMPYAIGLYLFSSLWTWITTDQIALVRGVTAATDVIAGALLYPIVLRAWNDRRSAMLAVLAYQLTPLSFAVLGNANLANIFGQSMALVAMAAAVSWPLDVRRQVSGLAFVFVLTWALCSHVSTVTTLSATLGVLAILYYWRGDTERRRAAVAIAVAVAISLGLAWLAYYHYFSDEFAGAFSKMFAGAPAAAPAAQAAEGYMTTGGRVMDLLRQAASSAGWPLLLLAGIGTMDLVRRGTRDRLVSALMAWGLVWVLFSASTVFARVGDEYVRYAAEFLGRINLATLPLIAVLAARGAAAPGFARRLLTGALVAWAVVNAAQSWLGWFNR